MEGLEREVAQNASLAMARRVGTLEAELKIIRATLSSFPIVPGDWRQAHLQQAIDQIDRALQAQP